MKLRLLSALSAIFALGVETLAFAEIAQELPNKIIRQHDFEVAVSILEGKTSSDGDYTVCDIVTFQIDRASTEKENYTIFYFIDEIPVSMKKDVTLPLSFKMNLKGLTSGTHAITFNVIDGMGNIATKSIVFSVAN